MLSRTLSKLTHISTMIVLLMILVVQPTYASQTNTSIETLEKYIAKICKKDCVDPHLFLVGVREIAEQLSINPITLIAIIRTESGFRPKAINTRSGRSVGLGQIQVYWHKEKFRTNNYTDVFDNIYVTAQIYSDCVKRWTGSREKALWCYNGHQKKGFRTYVPKVLHVYREIEQLRLEL